MAKKKSNDDSIMTRKEVKDELNKLIRIANTTPKMKPIQPRLGKESIPDNSKDTVEDLLNYLRVCLKYTIYDLECSRREVEWLKKLLKDNDIDV